MSTSLDTTALRSKSSAALPRPVTVGIESTGYAVWFHTLTQRLGHTLLVGDAAKIRAMVVHKTKTDRRDALHILQGSTLLRFALGQAASHAARMDVDLKRAYFTIMHRRGRPKAKVAVARKLLVRLFIMRRDQIDYDEFRRRGRRMPALGSP